MIKKIYIQLILISILVIISFSLFLKYFKQPNLKNDFNISLGQTTNTDDNLIEDLKYLSTDKEGNEYKIEAKKGNIDQLNPDIIYLESVKAVISLQSAEYISIESKFAKYNTKNFDTLFNGMVSVDYGEHILRSEYLDLSLEDNLVSIYNNVRYQSGISSLTADKAEIDISNKKTKIFMEDPNKKVQISNTSKNGDN
tara:strand:+ start:994 stop:1584 length:591 start_codon:yes stop_codon:yes gene_type:complete